MEERSEKLLNYIKQCIKENGYQPSYTEMCEYMELKSKSSIFEIIDYLESLGKVQRVASRAIKIF